MRIAVYGGSFNPPHLGHVRCAQAAADFLSPDLFLIIPDYLPPHKTLAENSPTAEARLEMCRIAFRNVEAATVSDLELQRAGPSFTSDTVRELRRQYPDAELFLIIGSDMLFSFTRWHEYSYILSQCTLAVASRQSGESMAIGHAVQHLLQEGAAVRFIPYEPLPASSTEIRKALADGEFPTGLDDEVYHYILQHGCYFEQ